MMIIKLLAIVLMVLGCTISALNWYSIYASYKSSRNVSPIPIFGALFLVLGLLGFQPTRPYAWLGILADWGTIAFICAVPIMAWKAWTTSRFNRLHRFVSDFDGRRDDIRLFKRNKFTAMTKYHPAVACNDLGAHMVFQGRSGTWRADGESFILEGYEGNKVTEIKSCEGELISVEYNYPDSKEFQYDRMGGLRLNRVE